MTFDLNFWFLQSFSMDRGYKVRLSINSFSLFTCKLVSLLDIHILKDKSSYLYWYKRQPLYVVYETISLRCQKSDNVPSRHDWRKVHLCSVTKY